MADPRPRTIVYIDGFNLYYGAVRGTPHKWLNLQHYFTAILPKDDIVAIKYFTALVRGATSANQRVFWDAVRTLPKVQIIEGLFKEKAVRCTHEGCTLERPRRFRKYEEKRTDVNIAVHMLEDAYQQSAEHFVVVSGDSDLVPPVRAVKHRFPSIKITVIVPAREAHRAKGAVELRGEADEAFVMPQHMLRHAQFPDRFTTPAGTAIEKPPDWYVSDDASVEAPAE